MSEVEGGRHWMAEERVERADRIEEVWRQKLERMVF